MPIEIFATIEPCDQEAFHALDRLVMREVFNVHNEFGRLFEEDLYKRELAARCAAIGILPAEREVQIRVIHENFTKDYFVDLLLAHSFMLEGKAAERLVGAHRNQAINYLLLLGLQHGRLVNFRSNRVEYEFVSTTLTSEERHRFRVVDAEWIEMDVASRQLRLKLIELLRDWGAFLDVNLYREALVHFQGGTASVSRAVQIFSGTHLLGVQNFILLNKDTAFAITSKPRAVGTIRQHLERLLGHTHLKAIQWINLNRHLVEFATLVKKPTSRIIARENYELSPANEGSLCVPGSLSSSKRAYDFTPLCYEI